MTLAGVRHAAPGEELHAGNRALLQALARKGAAAGTVTLISITGDRIIAAIGLALRLHIDQASPGNAILAFADSPAFGALDLETKPALLLGVRELRLFRRVALDFQRRKVLFDIPDAN